MAIAEPVFDTVTTAELALVADKARFPAVSISEDKLVPRLDTEVDLRVRDARVTARGPLNLTGDPGIELAATGRSIDLRALWPELPPTAIDARAVISIWQSEQQVRVDFNGSTEPSTIGEHRLPALHDAGRSW